MCVSGATAGYPGCCNLSCYIRAGGTETKNPTHQICRIDQVYRAHVVLEYRLHKAPPAMHADAKFLLSRLLSRYILFEEPFSTLRCCCQWSGSTFVFLLPLQNHFCHFLLAQCVSIQIFYIHIRVLYKIPFMAPVPLLKPFPFRCDQVCCCPLRLLGSLVTGRIHALSLNLLFLRNELLIRWEVRE